MGKPTMKFDVVAYSLGTKTGYRPVLLPQDAVADLDFCREVVSEKRLAMSPEELLHAMEMVGEVGPAKVAQDGRPRAITKLLKYNRFAQGTVDSPTSAWNASCRAYVRPQLMSEGTKEIVATFVNVNDGINVKLDNVTWIGARSVVNVLKTGERFAAYGKHMEFIEGDSASLAVGEDEYPLVCIDSDVAHAVFAWPEGLAPEAGTQAEFRMKSRGGVVDGEVYPTKKTVTIIAGDTPLAHIDEWYAGNAGNGVFLPANFPVLKGGGLMADADHLPAFAGVKNGNPVNGVWPLDKISTNTDEQLVLNYTTDPAFSFDDGSTVTITHKGITVTGVFNPS